jgi:transposase
METPQARYEEGFKRSVVTLVQNGKTQTQVSKEYGVSMSALSRWVRQYSEVKIDDETVITAKQVKELQKRYALLEEENLMPYSRHTQTKIERRACTAA